MTVKVEWFLARETSVSSLAPEHDFSDAYGQGLTEGRSAVVLSFDILAVVEGTPADLLAFAERVRAAAMALAERES